jgi:hypothetical protein
MDTPLQSQASFKPPGRDDRTIVVGRTGSGKTTLLAWLFSLADYHSRPFIIFDFKRDRMFDDWIKYRYVKPISIGTIPFRRGGIFICRPREGDPGIEGWLEKILSRGSIGLWLDEVARMPNDRYGAFQSILSMGRSKHVSVLMGNQRPVNILRDVFSEADYFGIFKLSHPDDRRIVKGFVRTTDEELENLPEHAALWYDVKRNEKFVLTGIPKFAITTDKIAATVPTYFW